MYRQVVRINVVRQSQLRIGSPTSASGKKNGRGAGPKLGVAGSCLIHNAVYLWPMPAVELRLDTISSDSLAISMQGSATVSSAKLMDSIFRS
jgi:hypothetical protein